MQHLDEGILSALLDGELSGTEQRDVETHLRACAECRDRLAELKGFMQESDQLITALDDLPQTPAARSPGRSSRYRALAWAASIVLAVGLGYAGQSMLRSDRVDFNAGRPNQSSGPVANAERPAPTAAQPPTTPEQPAAPSESRRSADLAEADRAAANQMASETEERAGRDSNGVVDSLALRGQVAVSANLRTEASQALNDAAAAAGAGAPAAREARKDSLGFAEMPRPGAVALDAPARERSARQAEPQAVAPAARISGVPADESQFAQKAAAPAAVPMEEAVRFLGGSIRLVDGLTPARFEMLTADSAVRVVYVTGGIEVWLDQRRIAVDKDDSLARRALGGLRNETAFNQLSWNDLQGFYLTLTGPLPTAVLEQLRARIQ